MGTLDARRTPVETAVTYLVGYVIASVSFLVVSRRVEPGLGNLTLFGVIVVTAAVAEFRRRAHPTALFRRDRVPSVDGGVVCGVCLVAGAAAQAAAVAWWPPFWRAHPVMSWTTIATAAAAGMCLAAVSAYRARRSVVRADRLPDERAGES